MIVGRSDQVGVTGKILKIYDGSATTILGATVIGWFSQPSLLKDMLFLLCDFILSVDLHCYEVPLCPPHFIRKGRNEGIGGVHVFEKENLKMRKVGEGVSVSDDMLSFT
ncbi:hypothetical protein L195_g022909 [Trifolium pratense]|uniref:Uncharacterized protein n=1 Tax=Trifolium pratense TaxID=57577 RepID=A0A2K3N9F7_TRIPR|nr:hypothetical protein L195_g022909 [Trifolium pratense]